VHIEKGQRVAAGDLLCTLDQGTRRAAVTQAEAAVAQAQSQFDTNASLRAEGLAPANSGLPLEAALTSVKAALENAEAELARTEIHSPVAGVVQDPLATSGNMLGPQVACATVVELDPMLFVGSVPEARIGLARVGLPAVIKTVTGQTIEGKVSYIAATADAVTRSFPVEIEMPNPDGKLRDGLTAEALVNLGTAPAHLLPQSVLTLDDDGVLGVRSVEGDTVAFHPVTIVRDTRDGVWVTGLPARIDIITVGQEFVIAGQKVNATNVTTTAEAEPTEGVAT
jgi:multidrug efflux system membrane fusion protein